MQHRVNITIIGVPDSTTWNVIAVLLAAGTGGNLSSYVGATIDILSGEKTIFDLIVYCCNRNSQLTPIIKPEIEVMDERVLELTDPLRHEHFPFINSFEEENLPTISEQNKELFFYRMGIAEKIQ